MKSDYLKLANRIVLEENLVEEHVDMLRYIELNESKKPAPFAPLLAHDIVRHKNTLKEHRVLCISSDNIVTLDNGEHVHRMMLELIA